jgi:hypothetical protein
MILQWEKLKKRKGEEEIAAEEEVAAEDELANDHGQAIHDAQGLRK